MQRAQAGEVPGLGSEEGLESLGQPKGPEADFNRLPLLLCKSFKNEQLECSHYNEAPRIWRQAPPGTTTLSPDRSGLASLDPEQRRERGWRVGAPSLQQPHGPP